MLHQFLMGTDSGDLSFLQDHNPVRVLNGTDSLGDDQAGSSFQVRGKAFPQSGIRPVIQGGEGIVKNEDFRFPGNGPGNGQALFLSAGQVCTALGDIGVIFSRKLFDEIRGLGNIQGSFPVFFRDGTAGIAEGQVFLYRSGKEDCFL